MNPEFSESFAVDEKAGLKPRDLFGRPVFKGMIFAQRIEQNIIGSQLIAALLILSFDLLLDKILNVLTGLSLSCAQAAAASCSTGQCC